MPQPGRSDYVRQLAHKINELIDQADENGDLLLAIKLSEARAILDNQEDET